jgi:hypothetical protein
MREWHAGCFGDVRWRLVHFFDQELRHTYWTYTVQTLIWVMKLVAENIYFFRYKFDSSVEIVDAWVNPWLCKNVSLDHKGCVIQLLNYIQRCYNIPHMKKLIYGRVMNDI